VRIFLFVVLVLASEASGALSKMAEAECTWVVSNHGAALDQSDNRDADCGKPLAPPCPSIQAAVDLARDGDTVCVMAMGIPYNCPPDGQGTLVSSYIST
jgi:hypothetical protein